MEVAFSNQVLGRLDEYAESLTRYPISESRIDEKVDKLKQFLQAVGMSLSSPPICQYKDLGQVFAADRSVLNKNLKRINYKDESDFQWAFACHYNYDNDIITIVKMMPASHIREESLTQNPILEFWKRLENLTKN